MMLKGKRKGVGLEIKTFKGRGGKTYIVFRAQNRAFHVFQEVEAKQAARDCGSRPQGNTRVMWNELWNKK